MSPKFIIFYGICLSNNEIDSSPLFGVTVPISVPTIPRFWNFVKIIGVANSTSPEANKPLYVESIVNKLSVGLKFAISADVLLVIYPISKHG